MRQVRLDPNHDAVMRIGGEAPGGGPILSVGLVPRQQPVPATSDRRPAVPVVDASSERRADKEMILQGFVRERLNKGLAMEKWSRNLVSQRRGGRLGAGFGRIRLPVRRPGAVRALYAPWQRSR